MARININFVGLWRVFLGVKTVTVEVNTINEARDFVEARYGPIFQKRFQASGTNNVQTIWEQSNIMLNGKNISQLDNPVLKDGDELLLLSKVAGG